MPPNQEREEEELNNRLITLQSSMAGALPAYSAIGAREFKAQFITAGQVRAAGNQPGNIIVEPEALTTAVMQGLFDDKAIFVDHAPWFENASLEKLAGVSSQAEYNQRGKSVEGVIRFYQTPTAQAIVTIIDDMLNNPENAPDVGLSLSFYGQWAPRDNYDEPRRLVGIKHVESIDLVFEPAAEGRILEALSAASQQPQTAQASP
ncbi:hypothetical protein ACFLZW_07960, partial [Chloroflexota bacterium]